jgi:UDP-glucuronate decarboxylase
MALMDVDPNPGAPVNLGNPGEFTINELVAKVRDMIPSVSEIVFRPLPQDDPQRRRPDISRAGELLFWEPHVPLAEGLKMTADWFVQKVGRADDDRAAGRNRRAVCVPEVHTGA